MANAKGYSRKFLELLQGKPGVKRCDLLSRERTVETNLESVNERTEQSLALQPKKIPTPGASLSNMCSDTQRTDFD